MKIKYDGSKYQIDLKNGLYILGQKYWLITRRLLRYGKRVCGNMTQQWITLLCAIIVVIIIIPIGIKTEQYKNWDMGIWDMKMFFLTSIIVILFSNIINSEKTRHKCLIRQYDIYQQIIVGSESYIQDICSEIGYKTSTDIFLTDYKFDEFHVDLRNHINNSNKSDQGINNNYLDSEYEKKSNNVKSITVKYRNHLKDITNKINEDTIVGYNPYYTNSYFVDTLDQLDELLIFINNFSKNKFTDEVLSFINTLSKSIYPMVACVRRPWRWDFERNQRVRKILVEKGKFVKGLYDRNLYWK